MIGYDHWSHYDNYDLAAILPAILISLCLLTVIGCIYCIIGDSILFMPGQNLNYMY